MNRFRLSRTVILGSAQTVRPLVLWRHIRRWWRHTRRRPTWTGCWEDWRPATRWVGGRCRWTGELDRRPSWAGWAAGRGSGCDRSRSLRCSSGSVWCRPRRDSASLIRYWYRQSRLLAAANSINPLTPTVDVWVLLQTILCQTGLSRHL